MKTSIWIDLEETVIYSWYEPTILERNVKNICKWVDQFGKQPNPSLNIFSYAIWNQNDFDEFWERIEPILANGFPENYVVNKVVPVDFLVEQSNLYDTSPQKYITFISKYFAFQQYCMNLGANNTKFVLFDDVVPNVHMEFKDTGNIIQTINITTM